MVDIRVLDPADGPIVRRAASEDAEELTRLRILMFEDMSHDVSMVDDLWKTRTVEHFRHRLLEVEDFAAFVIDKPGGGLAACAVGWLNPHLIGLHNMTERTGYVANMSTDREYRRRGYGRVLLSAIIGWMRSGGVGIVHLHASGDGEALYRSFGFTEPQENALTLRL